MKLGGYMTKKITFMSNQERYHRIVYTFIFIMLAAIALWGGYLGMDVSFLNETNSFTIPTEAFEPSLSVHRITEAEVGKNHYSVVIEGEDLEKLSGDELKIIINKPTDNAVRLKLNGHILVSEGDLTFGRSMLKNNVVYGSIERNIIESINLLEIETYTTYKSGIESEGIIITNVKNGNRAINVLEFFNSKLVYIGIGCLFFSSIFTFYLYLVSAEKEISWIYSSIATVALSIYFLDYVKIIDLSHEYFFYKKIFLMGLALGCGFYLLSMNNVVKSKLLKKLVLTHIISLIVIMVISKNMIDFKTYYEYWYIALTVLIFIMLGNIIASVKGNTQAYIYLISFSVLGVYTLFVVFIEFAGGYFILNSPILYIMILAATPLINAFEVITEKDRKIEIEQELKEKAFIESMTDCLTGTWNKRFLELKLSSMTSDLVMAIIDFDDFKRVNDQYGHLAGDYILKEISSMLLKGIHQSDELFRYGGDEFVIMFDSVDIEKSKETLGQIRESISHRHFHFDNHVINISVSFGMGYMDVNEERHLAFNRIDQALYKAKQEGKNMIVMSDLAMKKLNIS